MKSPGRADAGTRNVNEASAVGGAAASVRESVVATRPVVEKLTRPTPPRSSADTITVVGWPGRTASPVLAPVIRTTGATASSTKIDTGAAWPTWPAVSEAEASIRMVAPGAASSGTLNPNDSVRSVPGEVNVEMAASCGRPVWAL